MPEHSSMYSYLNWTKERLDEMDATLGSLEAKASQVKADAKAKADHLITDLKKRARRVSSQSQGTGSSGRSRFTSYQNTIGTAVAGL
jgi:hypothetical protein